MVTETEYAKAYGQALRFLGPRFLSRFELRQKLRRKEFSDESIDAVLDRLEELGYVDDERLARQVLRIHIDEQRYGRYYIVQKMRQRGLIPPTELLQSYDELQAAFRQLEKKFPLTEGPYDRGKVLRFLQNRGFSSSTCSVAIIEYGIPVYE